MIYPASRLFASLLLLSLASLAHAKAEDYVIDVDHTKVGFEIGHLVISTVEGSFKKFTGSMFLDPKDLTASAKKPFLIGEVDVASIDTGIPKRDKHLRSKDFFEVAKYPSLKFVATKVKNLKGKKFELEGKLTIKDVTRPVSFEMKYKGSVVAYEIQRVAFEGELEIDRKDFGLTWNNVVEAGPVVGDNVTIELVIQAKRKADVS